MLWNPIFLGYLARGIAGVLSSFGHEQYLSMSQNILYIKAIVVFVCLCGQCLEDSSSHCPFPVELVTIKAIMVMSVCVGNAWKILPITAYSLWS
jgi:hypothetical protein